MSNGFNKILLLGLLILTLSLTGCMEKGVPVSEVENFKALSSRSRSDIKKVIKELEEEYDTEFKFSRSTGYRKRKGEMPFSSTIAMHTVLVEVGREDMEFLISQTKNEEPYSYYLNTVIGKTVGEYLAEELGKRSDVELIVDSFIGSKKYDIRPNDSIDVILEKLKEPTIDARYSDEIYINMASFTPDLTIEDIADELYNIAMADIDGYDINNVVIRKFYLIKSDIFIDYRENFYTCSTEIGYQDAFTFSSTYQSLEHPVAGLIFIEVDDPEQVRGALIRLVEDYRERTE